MLMKETGIQKVWAYVNTLPYKDKNATVAPSSPWKMTLKDWSQKAWAKGLGIRNADAGNITYSLEYILLSLAMGLIDGRGLRKACECCVAKQKENFD